MLKFAQYMYTRMGPQGGGFRSVQAYNAARRDGNDVSSPLRPAQAQPRSLRSPGLVAPPALDGVTFYGDLGRDSAGRMFGRWGAARARGRAITSDICG